MSRKVSNMSTLHYGGIFGDLEDLERALAGGEDVKGTSNPDWQICAVDKNVVVKLLLSQTDINVNLEDDQGSTALHWKSVRSCTRWTGRKTVLTALKK